MSAVTRGTQTPAKRGRNPQWALARVRRAAVHAAAQSCKARTRAPCLVGAN
eukprot:CAMPEP_0204539652 /NCGR_PEP_ID=MMETSP0661-20131031/16900_1 /ASSEMBLY_ACC=CAM_ASM_000606 /TAXON_ID=109239 /ORGANISM="Alexandrium margalefi, Strain AMGDE01CS-322" /LENGTH=50 /DNA_ID=CAMNT_0051546271 /DNA_START=121 /DNA_END=270 /DNA_ORIENTATION=+